MPPILRPFTSDDLRTLSNRDGQQLPIEIIERQAAAGIALTATVDGRTLGCAGLVVVWPGVAVTWMVLGVEAAQHAIWLTRTVRIFLQGMQQLHQLHRIEALALEESGCNRRWLEVLGFAREEQGRARGLLTDRRTLIRYELVKGM